MDGLFNPGVALRWVARRARLFLVLGLVAGVSLPGMAAQIRPWLPHLVAFTLFVTALRVGFAGAFGGTRAVGRSFGLIVALQVVLPLAALVVLNLGGWSATPAALAVLFALSAPSIAGAPNFAIMTGHDPGPAMRLFVLGTALFPLTVLPVLWLAPGLEDANAGAAALRLISVILLATGLGFTLRATTARHWTMARLQATDGVAALSLSILVIGLMSALGAAIRDEPGLFLQWLALAFAVNTGVQIVALLIAGRGGMADSVPFSIVAGNRNVALFLIALPAVITDPLLVFIGCYQIPMFLTPLVMKPLHDKFG